MSYCIIKTIEREDLPNLNVILLNKNTIHTEVWEFDTEDEADKIAENLELNSDSGHKYTVKKIGSE